MNRLIEIIAFKGVATIFIFLMILFYGFSSYTHIPRERNPSVKIPLIMVNTSHSGISPTDAEKFITKKLEKHLKNVKGLDEMISHSFEGGSHIQLKFLADFDSEEALRDVRNKVSDAERDLHADTDPPSVIEIDTSELPILTVGISGDVSEYRMIPLVRRLRDDIETLPSVLSASIEGDRDQLLEISILPEMIEKHQLRLDYISQAVREKNQLVAAGKLYGKDGVFSVKVPNLISNTKELLDFPIHVEGDAILRLGDVADISLRLSDKYSIARMNNKPAMLITIQKKNNANIIDTVKQVKHVVAEHKELWGDNVRVTYSDDTSKDIINILSELENGVILSFLLVMTVIVLTINWRSAALVALSLPFSFLLAMAFLDTVDISLNIVVLFSLILTTGMVIDDAIVVSEYADREISKGIPYLDSHIRSAKRMLVPVFTSTLVKMIVFMPLLFWPGPTGQFMKYMPISVIVVLSSSFLFAILFQPALSHFFFSSKGNSTAEAPGFIVAFEAAYKRFLTKVIRYPKTLICVCFSSIALIFGIFAVSDLGTELFPNIAPERCYIVARNTNDNLSIDARDVVMKSIEGQLAPFVDKIDSMYTKVTFGDQVGSVNLTFTDWRTRENSFGIVDGIRSNLRVPGVTLDIISETQGGPGGGGKIIRIDVSGYNDQATSEAVDVILDMMKQDPEIINIEDNRGSYSMEWKILRDTTKAAVAGVDIQTLGNAIKMITNGVKISSYYPDDASEERDIILRFPEEYRNFDTLDNIKIVGYEGVPVPISNFITRIPQRKVGTLHRVDSKRVTTITADVVSSALPSKVMDRIKAFTSSSLPDDVSVSFKGEEKSKNETMEFLIKSFILALLCMFTVMLIQFNNLYHTIVVMLAVFLSTGGVILGLLLTQQPFGIIMCGIGVIALSGIVLNNTILYVDTVHKLLESGVRIESAAIQAAVYRVRPILLTAMSAILGLLPMTLGITVDFIDRDVIFNAPSSEWWRQLAASISGGLAFATLLTLFITPALILLGKRFAKLPEKSRLTYMREREETS